MPTLTFEEIQAAAIREKFIEAGARSGHLGAGRSPYSRDDSGGITVYVSEQRRTIQLAPANIHGPGAPSVMLVCRGEGRTWWSATVPITWDAPRTDWKPYDPASTRDVAGELWNVIELHARLDGWTLPSK